ncbi:Mov34/MPN/PAD-1 family protein [Qipengyuania sp. MTN3-11]|uniref:Mov34/MPN/PAD-1 family protein n=1 Tax=Qipengyuania sp. MTN3-11 TaxID=3056557 RepID=UPI0036F2FCCB
MDLFVTSDVLAAMRDHARVSLPNEACGVLFGSAGAIDRAARAENVHPDPARHFEIDPQLLIDAHRKARQGGPAVAGYYHSHPSGVAEPSATDRALAAGDGMVWAIMAAGAITFWRDDPGGFIALSYTVGPA